MVKVMLNEQKEKSKKQVEQIMYEKLVVHKPV
jgi:hypothetical protein